MFVPEVTLAMAIIAVAGGISVLALLFSKMLMLLRNLKSKKTYNEMFGYECGFKSELEDDFIYLTEKHNFISVYLIFELAIFWLLLCCTLDVMNQDWSGKLFIRILLLAIFAMMTISYKTLFNKIN